MDAQPAFGMTVNAGLYHPHARMRGCVSAVEKARAVPQLTLIDSDITKADGAHV